LVPFHISTESNEDGLIRTNKSNIQNVFVYNGNTFEKINPISINYETGEIKIEHKYCNVEVDFNFWYSEGTTICTIGKKLV